MLVIGTFAHLVPSLQHWKGVKMMIPRASEAFAERNRCHCRLTGRTTGVSSDFPSSVNGLQFVITAKGFRGSCFTASGLL
jgi:hypothetical protein